MALWGAAGVDVIDDPAEIAAQQSPQGKPFLRITLGEETFDITTNLAEMIGGVAAGVRKRWEERRDRHGH
jgi:hypothetical protein